VERRRNTVKVFRIAGILMLLAGPAHAQFAPTFALPGDKEMSDEDKARLKANEAAAKAASATVAPQKTSNDPWAGARAPDTPKPIQPGPKAKK